MTISKIKEIFKKAKPWEYQTLIKEHENDKRASVIKLINSYKNKNKSFLSKEKRMKNLSDFDNSFGVIVAGIDEAGRGPLFGPVFAATCVIKPTQCLYEVFDSKKISESKREYLYNLIVENSISFGISSCGADYIDKYGIQKAISNAMKNSYEIVDKDLKEKKLELNNVLIDFVSFKIEGVNFTPVVKGDQKSFSIACASILAKVSRDRLIKEYDKIYPEYGLIKNKGYGTEFHINALRKYGITKEHRKSFLKGFLNI